MGDTERTMREQAWARGAIIRGAAAVVLAAAMLLPINAGAYPSSGSIAAATGHDVATFGPGDEGWRTNEPDPTDDGSIIIECVVFDGGAPTGANMPKRDLTRLMALPQFPLGPTKCWPREYKRT
jgi:hypothetical protein